MKKLFYGGQVYNTDTRSFEQLDLLTSGAQILRIAEGLPREADELIDCSGKYLIPGLVDVHSHGRAGFDFNTADADDIFKMRLSYGKAGTTTLMATLASATPESLYSSCEAIVRNTPVIGGVASIAGVHFEGRYLNEARRGAHPANLLATPDAAEVASLIDCVLPCRVHVSAALELADDDFYEAVLSRGGTLGIAHSDATYDEAMSAVNKGATSFTHTFNAMRPLHHREPGNIAASLLSDAYSEIICDGEHVHPAMISMLSRLKPAEKLVLITDSMEGAGCADGEYSIAGLKVIVRDGRAVNVDGALAGSTLDMLTALKNYVRFTGIPLEEAIPAATQNPAAMVGIENVCGSLREGLRADILLVNDKENLNLAAVYAAGQKIN